MENFMFTHAGMEWNEDRGYVCEDFGFVLDGATSLLGENYTNFATDAEWYSNRWCEYLKVALKDKSKSILSILEEGFESIVEEYKNIAGGRSTKDFPGSTVSIVRENGEEIEMYVLADSPILIQDKFGDICIFADTRNNANDFVIHEIVRELAMKEKINVTDARKIHPEKIMDGRIKSNKFGGYYVLSNSKSALKFGFYQTMPKWLAKKIILMTDGFAQIYEVFKFMSPEEIAKKLNSASDAEKMFNKLVSLQQKDRFGNKFVRFKTTDDSTVVVMNFN